MIGRLEGTNPALGVIAIGSHSDTVPSGGRFDGIAGVATGLEIVRAFRDSGIRTEHSIEIIDFLAEEPSEYGLSCVGSRGMTGLLDARMLSLTDPGGETLRDALGRVGGDPDRLDEARRDDIKAFLELHIEQGIVLESRSLDVGIVTSIVGIRRIEIIFQGEADHAGTTPMGLRHDALVAAAATVCSVRRLCRGACRRRAGLFRRHRRHPDSRAVGVEHRAGTRSADRRCANDQSGADPTFRRSPRSREPGARRSRAGPARVVRKFIRRRSGWRAIQSLRSALRAGARDLGLGETDLPSGAGHDAAFMSRICPSAMVFVPCRAGKSHAPEEWADREAIAAGAAVIYQAVRALDRSIATGETGTGGLIEAVQSALPCSDNFRRSALTSPRSGSLSVRSPE